MASIRASTSLLKPFFNSALLFLLFATIATCNGEAILGTGESLKAGSYLQEGHYVFKMQKDCNLVLYDGRNAIWASGTNGRARNCHVTMQSDGNLVVYTPKNKPIWASNSVRGRANYVLILQKDRNVVIYGPAVWATNTNLPTLNRNGALMPPVVINALNQTNSTANPIKTVV